MADIAKGPVDDFLVVGIGASAGGLEALKLLLPALPDNEDIVYVVCQHMDPKHDSLLSTLLSGSTAMNVTEITHAQELAPNQIFIAPPGHDLSIEGRRFELHKPDKSIGPKPSVDRFLTSLAGEFEERSVGIILSGTGGDGALGMRAIKAAGGITIVQSPETAKYDGMPRAAIDTGSVDLVMVAPEVGSELLSIIQSPMLAEVGRAESVAPDDLARLMLLLKTHLGHDFSEYKENTIHRRINRRLAVHKLNSLREYVEYAEKNPSDLDGLVKDILISVTEFFRDKDAFEELRKTIGQLVDSKREDEPIRVWVPGCSSGEEVYSLAFLFMQVLEDRKRCCKLQIYATDIDADMVAIARRGIYSEASLINIDQKMRNEYFRPENGEYQVVKSIRELVVFAKQDIIHDPPFSRIDLIACRNLLIYFSTALQGRLIAMFHYALKSGGVLFLGKSESIGQHKDLFAPVNKRWRIFRRKDSGKTMPASFRTSHFLYTGVEQKHQRPQEKVVISHKEVVERAVSTLFGPPSVLVNEEMQILYAKGDCPRYFEIAEGNVGLSVFDLIKGDLKAPLRTTIGRAIRERAPVSSVKNRLMVSGETFVYVDIHAQPGGTAEVPEGFVLVSFVESLVKHELKVRAEDAGDLADQRIVELEHELAAAHERLQTTVEELETSNEELQSLNEELQSANEELQSTNEELETSNEELQATNEELATVNEEMQIRSMELAEANSDLENVFKRMGIPLVVLDMDLRVRRYTPALESLFNFMPGDKGQIITNLGTHITIPSFRALLEGVLQTGTSHQEIVQNSSKLYEMRIYPYYDERDVINGLLVSFYDITLANQREQEFRALAENAPDIVTRFDRNFRHLYLNKTIERHSARTCEEFIGKTDRELGMPEALCAFWEQELGKVFTSARGTSFEFEFPTPDGMRWFDTRVVPELGHDGSVSSALAISRDITDLKRIQKDYEDTLRSINDGFFVLNEDLRVEYFNEAAGRLLGRSPKEVLGKPLFDSFPEARGSIFEEKYLQALQTGEDLTFESYFGEEPYANWYSVSVYAKEGGISVYFQVTTEQKEAHLEIQRQSELVQAILDNIPVLIVLYDAEINTLLVNREFEKTVGWSKVEIRDGTIMEKCYPDPDYRAQAQAYMDEVTSEWREFTVQTKSGRSIDTIWSNVKLTAGSQVGIGIDISEKKEMERLLNRKAKLEALGTLAGGIAHDFNNCLASILGFAELAQSKDGDRDDRDEELAEVIAAGMRARDLVKQILTFSQGTSPPKEAVVVNRIVRDVVRMLSSTVPANIRLEPVVAEEDIVVMADATHVHQVVMNLCTNAVDSMRGEGGSLRIGIERVRSVDVQNEKVRVMASDDLLKLSISDSGCGIEQDDLERLFDPYFSTKGPGRGQGLGLAVVDGIVRKLDGEIVVESERERGSVFRVFLPAMSAADSSELLRPTEIPDAAPRGTGSERILVVDDEPPIAKMLKRLLTRAGYDVTAFTDVKEALNVFERSPEGFDLVITDMTMPSMTGARFARSIKAIAPHMPIILCTGHSEHAIPDRIEDIGIDAFLMKPMNHRELRNTVHRLLVDR